MRLLNIMKFGKEPSPAGKASSRPTGRRRPRARPIRRQPLVWAVALTLIVGGVVGTSWQLWRSGQITSAVSDAKWSLIAGSAHLGFSVKEIFVEGRHQTSRETLLAALRLKRGAPILAFDPAAARLRVEALPWVRGVSIERHLPNAVHLRIEERIPLALWQRGGEFSLIDAEGTVIPDPALDRFGKLVVVVGKDAPAHAAALLDTLAAEPALALRVTAAVRVAGRRWNVHIDDKITVRLPEKGATQAWRHLAQLAQRNGLLDQDLVAVDLRIPDRVVVRRAQPAGRKPQITERDT